MKRIRDGLEKLADIAGFNTALDLEVAHMRPWRRLGSMYKKAARTRKRSARAADLEVK
jgi:hypothetical protein